MEIIASIFILGTTSFLVWCVWERLYKPPTDLGRTVSIWLDPENPAPHGWTRAKSPEQAIHCLKTCEVPSISFGDVSTKERWKAYSVMAYIELRAAEGKTVPHLIRFRADDTETHERLTGSRNRIRNLEMEKRGTVHFHVDRHAHGG